MPILSSVNSVFLATILYASIRADFIGSYLSTILTDNLLYKVFSFQIFTFCFYFHLHTVPYESENSTTVLLPQFFMKFQPNFMINVVAIREYRELIFGRFANVKLLCHFGEFFLNTGPYDPGNFKMLTPTTIFIQFQL